MVALSEDIAYRHRTYVSYHKHISDMICMMMAP